MNLIISLLFPRLYQIVSKTGTKYSRKKSYCYVLLLRILPVSDQYSALWPIDMGQLIGEELKISESKALKRMDILNPAVLDKCEFMVRRMLLFCFHILFPVLTALCSVMIKVNLFS